MEERAVLAALAPRLHQFVAVARSEHMTRAADEIEVPQSTLSRGIARLEDELGVALFVRVGRSVRLTREGRTLLRYAERALGELVAADREIRGDADALHGRVGLAFHSTLGATLVPELLRTFRASHPGVRFELVQGPNALLVDRLRAGEVDLAVTSPLPDEPGMAGAQLTEEELVLAVPADHALAGRTGGVPLSAAAGEPFVTIVPGLGLRGTVEAWCRQAGFVPRSAFEGADLETLRGLVGAGLGVALLPPAARPTPAVVELHVTEPRTTRPVGLVWMRGRPLPPPAQALRAFVGAAPGAGRDEPGDDPDVPPGEPVS